MVVAHPNEYGGCHNPVVVVAFHSSHLLAVLFKLIEVELIGGLNGAFNVEPVA